MFFASTLMTTIYEFFLSDLISIIIGKILLSINPRWNQSVGLCVLMESGEWWRHVRRRNTRPETPHTIPGLGSLYEYISLYVFTNDLPLYSTKF